MASNFSDDPQWPAANAPAPAMNDGASTPTPAPTPSAPAAEALSPAVVRFRSCRWYQAPDNGNGEFCTHREVKPYAGTTGFDASAWCPDCAHYKPRRQPKKRDRDDYFY